MQFLRSGNSFGQYCLGKHCLILPWKRRIVGTAILLVKGIYHCKENSAQWVEEELYCLKDLKKATRNEVTVRGAGEENY